MQRQLRQQCELASCAASAAGTGALSTNGCDNDWNTWWVGSRTQWNVTKDFYMGLDVMYSKLESATTDGYGQRRHGALQPRPVAGTPSVPTDPDNWSVRFRVHRDFYP